MNLILTLPLAFAAGMLTILSPCVLPLAPIVVASARAQDPRGPIALALGLAATFGVVGGLLASFGVEFGDWDWARTASAAIMIAIGVVLLTPALGDAIERRLGFAGRAADVLGGRLPNAGLAGQAGGRRRARLRLGAVRRPGPRGGVAARRQRRFGRGGDGDHVGLCARRGWRAHRRRLCARPRRVKGALRLGWRGRQDGAWRGVRLIGAAVLTGLDHHIEAVLVAAMPDWLTAFATSL